MYGRETPAALLFEFHCGAILLHTSTLTVFAIG